MMSRDACRTLGSHTGAGSCRSTDRLPAFAACSSPMFEDGFCDAPVGCSLGCYRLRGPPRSKSGHRSEKRQTRQA